MKTSKKILLTALLFCMGWVVVAQNIQQDVVYLKNGGIMRGSIIEFIPEKYLKIETIGGNVFVYQVGEIEKCVKEPINESTYNNPDVNYKSGMTMHTDSSSITHGYYGVFEFATGVSAGYMNGALRTKINFINGYRVCPWFATGLGFGFRFYPGNEVFMPFFVDLRTNFMNKRTSPYFSLGTGYSLCLSNVNNGGFMLTPTVGVSVKLKKRMAINLGLNYELQRTKVDYYYYDYYYYPYPPTRQNELTHTFSFQFGLSF
jgi:hypothetical protein